MDEATGSNSEARDNIRLRALQFGTTSDFGVVSCHTYQTPTSNTNFTAGNLITVQFPKVNRAFLDPQSLMYCYQFYVNTNSASENIYCRLDYNTSALADWGKVVIGGTEGPQNLQLGRFAMIMDDMYNKVPFSGIAQEATIKFTPYTTEQKTVSMYTTAVEEDGELTAQHTSTDMKFNTLMTGLIGTPAVGLVLNDVGVGSATSTLGGSLTCSTQNIYCGKQDNIFYGQKTTKKREGCDLVANMSGTTTTYLLSQKVDDFIIGRFAKKFVYLDAIKSLRYDLSLQQSNVAFYVQSSLYTDTSQLTYNLSQVRLYYNYVIVGGDLPELLQEAYVETNLPQLIQTTTFYKYVNYQVTSTTGQIPITVNMLGLKAIIMQWSRSNDLTSLNQMSLTNTYGGFVYLQLKYKNEFIPMTKHDYASYPYPMIKQFHQFQYGEPHYSSNTDLLYTQDEAMLYTGNYSATYNDGTSNTFNASDTAIDVQNDYWNAVYGGFVGGSGATRSDIAGVRNCSNFMWVFDNPNLYDHEFQESKRNVQSGDLMLEYTCVDMPVSGGATVHFFLLLSGNLESNIQDASITALAANVEE